MSESLYICAGSLCCCLVVCSVIRLVAPSGNTTNIMSLVIGVFALCCLVSPVVSMVKNIDLSQIEERENYSSEEFSELCDEQVLKTTGDYINSYTSSLLSEADVIPENIETVLGVNQNQGIYVKEMNIYLNKNSMYKSEEIKELISASVGVEPVITEIQYEQ